MLAALSISVSSRCMRSAMPGNIVLPPERITSRFVEKKSKSARVALSKTWEVM